MAAPVVRVGMVGSGFMAKAHSLAYGNQAAYFGDQAPRARKVRLADVTPELARAGADRFGWESSAADWREVTRADDVDLVSIVTPNDAHHDIAIDAVRHGKHVLCEKPLARTADEAKAMLDEATRAGVKHMVAFNYRKSPALAQARKLIEEGELGRVLAFRGRYLSDLGMTPGAPLAWRYQKARAGSGAIGDIGSHIIDVARFLVGDIERVCAVADTFIHERPLSTSAFDTLWRGQSGEVQELGAVDVDDAMAFVCRFAGGAPGTIECSRFAAGRGNHLAFELNGDRGSLVFDWERSNELLFLTTQDPAATRGFRKLLVGPAHPNGEELWPVPGIGVGYAESSLLVVRDLLHAIVTDTPVEPTFQDGSRVAAIVDAALESARSERWVSTR